MNPKPALDHLLAAATWTPIPAARQAESALPYPTHSVELRIGDAVLKCYRLSDGRAVFDAADVARLFGFGTPEALAADVKRLGGPELKPVEIETGEV